MDSELEELQLQVEGGICKLPIVEMEQLAVHVGLESKEYKGKSKLAMSRIVRAKVEVELGQMESKVEYLTELRNFIAGMPPPLKEQEDLLDLITALLKLKCFLSTTVVMQCESPLFCLLKSLCTSCLECGGALCYYKSLSKVILFTLDDIKRCLKRTLKCNFCNIS